MDSTDGSNTLSELLRRGFKPARHQTAVNVYPFRLEVRFADFTDAFGAAVSLDHAASLRGRLGLSIDFAEDGQDVAGQDSSTRLYATANLYYDYAGGSQANVEAVSLSSVTDPLSAGIGAGGSYSWGDGKYTVHGEALVKAGLPIRGRTTLSGARWACTCNGEVVQGRRGFLDVAPDDFTYERLESIVQGRRGCSPLSDAAKERSLPAIRWSRTAR